MAPLENGARDQIVLPKIPQACSSYTASVIGSHHSFGRSLYADGRLPADISALRTRHPILTELTRKLFYQNRDFRSGNPGFIYFLRPAIFKKDPLFHLCDTVKK